MRLALDIPAGLGTDDTTLANEGRWAAMNNMRFRLGRAQTRGGRESLTSEMLNGVCRSAFVWTDNGGTTNIAFGTHTDLTLYQGGALFDITPALALPSNTDDDPFTVVDASTTVTVAHANHGMQTGDDVAISGSVSVGRITPSGTYAVTVVDKDTYTITHGSAADVAETLGSNPLTVTNGSPVVTVADTAHGLPDGLSVTISGASAVGGITPNGTFEITVIDANSYSYTFTSNATSGATGGGAAVVVTVPLTGGGSAVVLTPQNAFAAGQINGTGSSGYGTGGYGVGGYGEPSSADYFPRTWALAPWGEQLIANPRGGTVYAWTNDTGVAAAPLANAPREVTHAIVTHTRQVMALGCNEEVSGDFNPLCIRTSGVQANTVWNSSLATTARENILRGGGRIVAGRQIADRVLVWTDNGLQLGTFVGQAAQTWRFDPIADHCGLIGPNAAIIVGQQAFWISPDRQFFAYTLGGVVTPMACPIREDFADNLAASQGDKIIASSIAEFGEVRWDYPDARDGLENSRYVGVNVSGPDAGAWFNGTFGPCTAMVDAGPSRYPCGVTYDASADQGRVYWYERGQSDDGAAMPWFIETADLYLSLDRVMQAQGLRPDFKAQVGAVTVTMIGRFYPAGDEEEQVAASMLAVSEDKADFLMTAALARFRFEGESSPAFCRIGKPLLDMVDAGGR